MLSRTVIPLTSAWNKFWMVVSRPSPLPSTVFIAFQLCNNLQNSVFTVLKECGSERIIKITIIDVCRGKAPVLWHDTSTKTKEPSGFS